MHPAELPCLSVTLCHLRPAREEGGGHPTQKCILRIFTWHPIRGPQLLTVRICCIFEGAALLGYLKVIGASAGAGAAATALAHCEAETLARPQQSK